MDIQKIPTPEVYRDSSDFRFFLKWFADSLKRIQYDTENLIDLYDPLRCKSDLLWMLGDTMGYKFDSRLCVAFNRLVLMYFMSMIRNKGSKDGVTLAAEVNLAQFSIKKYGQENDALNDRLEDTSIPVNAVYVNSNVSKGYIDVVYFSDEKPVDACIEYVRPLGMYCFQTAGVRYDSKTKISVDARLTNSADISMSIGATHVGHYSRNDYARMQKMANEKNQTINSRDTRKGVYYRNIKAEEEPDLNYNRGWRSLYSLQLSNNEHITRSLITNPLFGLGMSPQRVGYIEGITDDYVMPELEYTTHREHALKNKNLRYDRGQEETVGSDVFTVDDERTYAFTMPRPAVNPIFNKLGDAIAMTSDNTRYVLNDTDEIGIVRAADIGIDSDADLFVDEIGRVLLDSETDHKPFAKKENDD